MWCYKADELRGIYSIIVKSDECADLLKLYRQKEINYIDQIRIHKSIEADMERVISIKDNMILVRNDEVISLRKAVKAQRRKSILVVTIASVVSGLVLIGSIK